MSNEIAFEMAVSSVRFGPGVTREVGMDLADMRVRHALVITDPVVRNLRPVEVVLESLHTSHIPYTVYDRVRVEPTEESFLNAIAFAKTVDFDAIVAVGGGSTIDTAKAVNPLYDLSTGGLPRLRESAHWQRVARSWPPKTVDCHSHHGGHRQRNYRRQHFRFDSYACQDRDCKQTAEAGCAT
jgi:alcohol dehydrogenase class IV